MAQIDREAISGIFGAISIACWVVVFTPQIYHTFKNKKADGLSLHFMIIWMIGDIFNVIGSITQHVLPSMIILAVYYTISDVVVLGQMFWYRGWIPGCSRATLTKQDHVGDEDNQLDTFASTDGSNPDQQFGSESDDAPGKLSTRTKRHSYQILKAFVLNTSIVIGVVCAGVFGWLIQDKINGSGDNTKEATDIAFNNVGQTFGYLCAAMYIISRIPQLWLNWKRKATEGLSMLFFIFAILGNLTYVISILVYKPICAGQTCHPDESRQIYKKYLLVNLSWILGSSVNVVEDCAIFAQYLLYRKRGHQLD